MRLFFALWPDGAARRALAELAAALAPLAGGKPVPADRIHVTLAFLGEVAPGRLGDVLGIEVAAAPFEVRLDRVGAFRGARVAWAGASRAEPALLALQSSLARALRDIGFALEDRPFTPHATLARDIRRPVPGAPVEPVAWRAASFALVRSEPGTGRYSTVREWRLGE